MNGADAAQVVTTIINEIATHLASQRTFVEFVAYFTDHVLPVQNSFSTLFRSIMFVCLCTKNICGAVALCKVFRSPAHLGVLVASESTMAAFLASAASPRDCRRACQHLTRINRAYGVKVEANVKSLTAPRSDWEHVRDPTAVLTIENIAAHVTTGAAVVNDTVWPIDVLDICDYSSSVHGILVKLRHSTPCCLAKLNHVWKCWKLDVYGSMAVLLPINRHNNGFAYRNAIMFPLNVPFKTACIGGHDSAFIADKETMCVWHVTATTASVYVRAPSNVESVAYNNTSHTLAVLTVDKLVLYNHHQTAVWSVPVAERLFAPRMTHYRNTFHVTDYASVTVIDAETHKLSRQEYPDEFIHYMLQDYVMFATNIQALSTAARRDIANVIAFSEVKFAVPGTRQDSITTISIAPSTNYVQFKTYAAPLLTAAYSAAKHAWIGKVVWNPTSAAAALAEAEAEAETAKSQRIE